MLKSTEVKRVYKPRGLKQKLKQIVEKELGRPLLPGEVYTLQVNLLPKNSRDVVEVICDYCTNEWPMIFNAYNKALGISYTKTIACKNCKYQKRYKEAEAKQKFGLLKEGDLHYWSFEENRIKALRKWLDENAGNKTIFHASIYKHYQNYNVNIWDDIKKLDYDIDKVRLVKPNRWWYDFINVRNLIETFMEKESQGRFPAQNEFWNNIKIPSTAYMFHGGITGMKAKMDYIDDYAILDIEGRQHKSSYEAILANFLIAHNLPIVKEAKIVSDEPYLSDFDLSTNHINLSKRLLVEIWGFNKDDAGFNKDYNVKREIKEEVYNKNRDEIELISLESSHFTGTYQAIGKGLYDIFSKFIKLGIVDLEKVSLHPRGKNYLTQEKMEELLKSYSNDGVTLLSSNELSKRNNTLYKEIIKNFETVEAFASRINMKVVRLPAGYWTLEKIFEAFDEMYKVEGRYIQNVKEIRSDASLKKKYGCIIDAAYSNDNGGWNKVWEQYIDDRKLKGLITETVKLRAFRHPAGYWTLEKIFEAFDEMYKVEGRYITNSTEINSNVLLKEKYGALYTACKKEERPGWKKCWQQYFEKQK